MKFKVVFGFLCTLVKAKDIFEITLGPQKISEKDVQDVLESDGALAVTGLPSQYGTALSNLQSFAGNCLQNHNYPVFHLADGSLRQTLAVDSEHLERSDLPECIEEDLKIIEDYFTEIDDLISTWIMRIAGQDQVEWKVDERSFELDQKLFKDHLHVYQRNVNETLQKNSYSVPFHKDRGLILYVSHSPDHPVQIKNKKGSLLNTSNLDMNSVIVILGSGLTDWLLENSHLHASSHGVPSLTEQLTHRVVVARMKFGSKEKDNICVILLFKSWILNTRTKFIIGCVGVVILGIAIEALLCLRRSLQSRKLLLRISSPIRRVLIILLFGVNVASGYFAMLVAMTYSVELFMCMVAGLLLGHAIFNSEAAVGESVDPCCASQTIATKDQENVQKISNL